MNGYAVTYGLFLDAYKYSSNYLIFSLSVMIASIFIVWIYEKPEIYKLIFKRSKHSNVLSPVQSNESLEDNCNQLMKEGINNMFEEKTLSPKD